MKRRQLRLSAFLANAGFEAAKDDDYRFQGVLGKLAVGCDKGPNFRLLGIEVEIFGHNPHDGAILPIERQTSADDIGRASQPALPKAVAQHSHMATVQILLFERSALRSMRPEH